MNNPRPAPNEARGEALRRIYALILSWPKKPDVSKPTAPQNTEAAHAQHD